MTGGAIFWSMIFFKSLRNIIVSEAFSGILFHILLCVLCLLLNFTFLTTCLKVAL